MQRATQHPFDDSSRLAYLLYVDIYADNCWIMPQATQLGTYANETDDEAKS